MNRKRRHQRVRAKIAGTAVRPRLSVFRSNKYVYAQLIDDRAGRTLAASSDLKLPRSTKGKKPAKAERSRQVGEQLAKVALERQIKAAVFDRGGYKYHGRVKALAEGARQGGLKL